MPVELALMHIAAPGVSVMNHVAARAVPGPPSRVRPARAFGVSTGQVPTNTALQVFVRVANQASDLPTAMRYGPKRRL